MGKVGSEIIRWGNCNGNWWLRGSPTLSLSSQTSLTLKIRWRGARCTTSDGGEMSTTNLSETSSLCISFYFNYYQYSSSLGGRTAINQTWLVAIESSDSIRTGISPLESPFQLHFLSCSHSTIYKCDVQHYLSMGVPILLGVFFPAHWVCLIQLVRNAIDALQKMSSNGVGLQSAFSNLVLWYVICRNQWISPKRL